MKQQTTNTMDILPQLDKACGLDIHKDKIVGFIACKDGSGQELKEFGTFYLRIAKGKGMVASQSCRTLPDGKYRHLLDELIYNSYRLWHFCNCCESNAY